MFSLEQNRQLSVAFDWRMTQVWPSTKSYFMRWEDQELNHATPENTFLEVFIAKVELLDHASKRQNRYVRVDQQKLEALIADGKLSQRTVGTRIDRLCLLFRLSCCLGPGGDRYPVFGVMHFWAESSHYAVLYFSPVNDWLEIMIVAAPAPSPLLIMGKPAGKLFSRLLAIFARK